VGVASVGLLGGLFDDLQYLAGINNPVLLLLRTPMRVSSRLFTHNGSEGAPCLSPRLLFGYIQLFGRAML